MHRLAAVTLVLLLVPGLAGCELIADSYRKYQYDLGEGGLRDGAAQSPDGGAPRDAG